MVQHKPPPLPRGGGTWRFVLEQSDDVKKKKNKLSADANDKKSDDVKENKSGVLSVSKNLSVETLVKKLNVPKHTAEELHTKMYTKIL